MGLEFPVLTILLSVVFLVVVLSTLLLHLHVVSEASRLPVVNVEARAFCTNNSTVRLVVVLRHARGDPVKVLYVNVTTEKGLVDPWREPGTRVMVLGLHSGKLQTGSTGYIIMDFSSEYFSSAKWYNVLIVLDTGTLIANFTPECTYEYPRVFAP